MTKTDARAAAVANFRTRRAAGLVAEVDALADGAALTSGFWVVVGTFSGEIRAYQFADVHRLAADSAGAPAPSADRTLKAHAAWSGPPRAAWESSLPEAAYMAAVSEVRQQIAAGHLQQLNLCRVLAAPLLAPPPPSALAQVLATGNPAKFGASVFVPETASAHPQWLVSASPELYLRVDDNTIASSPIKGTAAPGAEMLSKDLTENMLITELVKTELEQLASPNSVAITELFGLHNLPGLVHLQSTVTAELAKPLRWTDSMWPEIWQHTYPPASVSGAPRASSAQLINTLEPVGRGPYCGVVGWIDADTRSAELAVGIRNFWWEAGYLKFGTGAGITQDSDPAQEWAETELKAQRLIALASA